MLTAGKIIKHLIAKHGPLTTTSLASHITTFEKQLVSKSHLKHHVLASLEGQGVLHKQVYRESAHSKPLWRWDFINQTDATLHKELKQLTF
ncbi:hypothetical protein BC941DRAFT_464992 [Chlamydoabsidia padenii]|nr:hypothetical protein BC941DRAFT_464992 [Chlamydoabsidia padenii]